MLIAIIIIGLGLITWALYIMFFDEEPGSVQKIDLFPHRIKNNPNAPGIRLILRHVLIFFLVLSSLFYIQELVFRDKPTVVLNETKHLRSLTGEEYQTICLDALKPALEKASRYPDTSPSPKIIYDENAGRFAQPSGEALKWLCMAAENRYDPDSEDKFFNP